MAENCHSKEIVVRPEGMQFANEINADLWLAIPRAAIELIDVLGRMASIFGGVK